jgi:hypothetical protein
MCVRPPPLDLSIQPVLVLEIPREQVYPETETKYYSQGTSILELEKKVSFTRWKYIGQFVILDSDVEQVSARLSHIFFIQPSSLTRSFL